MLFIFSIRKEHDCQEQSKFIFLYFAAGLSVRMVLLTYISIITGNVFFSRKIFRLDLIGLNASDGWFTVTFMKEIEI